MKAHRARVALVLVVALVPCLAQLVRGADAIQDGFESPRPIWRQEQTDASINLLAHERSNRAAHEGRMSERFQFVAGLGSTFFYSYALPKIPVTDKLRAEVFVRSNRSGVRLYGRVLLPADTDPDTGQPSYLMVPGTILENADHWQRLELRDMVSSVERQARVLRAATHRPVSTAGAYLECLAVNLFGGAGETEVFLDELTVTPVRAEALADRDRPAAASPKEPKPIKAKPVSTARVQLDGLNRLKRKGNDGRLYDWLVTAIDAPGADTVKLRNAGFDVLAEQVDADPSRVREAIDHGFLLMPKLDATLEGRPIDAERMIAAASAYPFSDAVAFWSLGDGLGRARDLESREAELERVRQVVSGLRNLPSSVSQLTLATVDGALPLFARPPMNLAIMGIEPNILDSCTGVVETQRYLAQRRELTALANPEGLFLAWLPATPPPAVQSAIWGHDLPPAWGVPTVQPEQLRLFTFMALGSGYRGIGYRADASLTHGMGRMLLIEMALLNEEIDLCESILANGTDPIPLTVAYPADPPNLPPPGGAVGQRVKQQKEFQPVPGIRIAQISTRDRRGKLLLIADYADMAEFQPAQMALPELKVIVPAAEAAQAFLVSPGDVVPLERERIPGGIRFTIPEFGPTAIVLLTTDFDLANRMHAQIARVRPLAVQLAIEQADLKLRWVTEINERILADGQTLYDEKDPTNVPLAIGARPPSQEPDLLKKAAESIDVAREALKREDYPLAWSEARRATRPLRILMFAQWAKAYTAVNKLVLPPETKIGKTRRRGRLTVDEMKDIASEAKAQTPVLISPVSYPPLACYNTLPQLYIWLSWMKKPFGKNLVPSGDFDDHESLESSGWINQSYEYENVTGKVMTVSDPKDETKRYLKLSVTPNEDANIDDFPSYLDFTAAAVRTPPVRMMAGQFFRISVLVKKPVPSVAGAGGIVITDSIGGEALKFRTSNPISRFSRVTLYRRAPSNGVLTVTLGLAGFGEAYFEDFKIETVDDSSEVDDEVADRRLRAPEPNPGDLAPATARRPTRPARSSR